MTHKLTLASALVAGALLACQPEDAAAAVVPADALAIFQMNPTGPAADTPSSEALIGLGHRLYHDASLSAKGEVSCATCHSLETYGVDKEKTSKGTGGQRGDRNAPTSLNAFRHLAQFWDGRAATVEEQATGPILNPIEHGLKDEAEVVAILQKRAGLVDVFKKAFPGQDNPVTLANVGRAIGAFERTLVTTSPFDKFLDGDKTALNQAQKQGLIDFVATGCTTCHFSRLVGGQMYNKLGLLHPYETADTGRHRVSKKDEDKYFFKVPGLLNIAETGPYLHDGSIADLDEVVRIMGWHQLGKKLDAAKIKSIVVFLKSLTGELAK